VSQDSPRAVRATQAQGATFVELFFDLVFVFAITQVTAVLRDNLTATGLVRAVLIFWLVWWAWTQFTWTLNAADTEVYGPAGWWFALSYIAVRLIGMGGQWWVSSGDVEWSSAVRTWVAFSFVGLAAVAVAAALPAPPRTAALAVAVALDVFSAWRAGSGEWRLFPSHFAERHGLFVIIALGESLIAAGVAASALPRDASLAAIAVPAVLATCALWWTYFGWAKDALEDAMHRLDSRARGWFGRDVYSLLHFPIIGGVIGHAVAIEKAVEHPNEHLEPAAALALAAGATLFVGCVGLALLRAHSRVPLFRAITVLALLASYPLLMTWPPTLALTLVAVIVAAVAAFERNPLRADAAS
jgi:low temperature requirement protein LtrA